MKKQIPYRIFRLLQSLAVVVVFSNGYYTLRGETIPKDMKGSVVAEDVLVIEEKDAPKPFVRGLSVITQSVPVIITLERFKVYHFWM